MRSNVAMKALKVIVLFCLTLAVGALGSRLITHKVLHEDLARKTCIANLHWIAEAKREEAREMQLRDGASVSTDTLARYIEFGWPTCPAGGKYTANPIGKDPTCTVPGHYIAP